MNVLKENNKNKFDTCSVKAFIKIFIDDIPDYISALSRTRLYILLFDNLSQELCIQFKQKSSIGTCKEI